MSAVSKVQEVVNGQLLDVLISVGFVVKASVGTNTFPSSFIVRMDVEGDNFTEFIEGMMKLPGVVQAEPLTASDEEIDV